MGGRTWNHWRYRTRAYFGIGKIDTLTHIEPNPLTRGNCYISGDLRQGGNIVNSGKREIMSSG